DEIVRALDVQVVYRPVENHPLDALDDLEVAFVVHHHHPRADGRCRHERQRVPLPRALPGLASQAGSEPDGHVERLLDERDELMDPPEVTMARFESPASSVALRATDGEARRLECPPSLVVVAEERDPMDRSSPPWVAAE